MAGSKRVPDSAILELNSAGISLHGIARRLNLHHTTVSLRLKTLGVPLADTRRSFMEDVYDELTPAQRRWLHSQLVGGRPVKELVKSLMINEYARSR